MTDLNVREVYGVLESYCEMEKSKTGKTKRQNEQKKLRGKYFPRLKNRQRTMEIKSPLGIIFCVHINRKQMEKRQGTQQTFSCSWYQAYSVHGKGISASQNRFLTGSFSRKCWKRTFFSVKSTCFFGPIQLQKSARLFRKKVIPTWNWQIPLQIVLKSSINQRASSCTLGVADP